MLSTRPSVGLVDSANGVDEGDERHACTDERHAYTFDSARPLQLRSPGKSRFKRLMDIALALPLLIFTLPALLVLGFAVAISSPGGPLFVQECDGMNGKLFRLYKFRTMRAGTYDEVMHDPELRAEYEANGFKLANGDAHITPFGRALRKTSLDELPQLWNVVRGDMSLVGIRPLVPNELAVRDFADQAAYVRCRPGLTGLWQVEGRSSVVGSDRLALDRRYVSEWGLWMDVKILARTPVAVLRVDQTT